MGGGADALELKHDTASVYSMDSAYQSQSSASRRGAPVQDGFQSHTPQDNRSRVSSQFLGSDIYSPTLSAEPFNAFPEQHSDLSQMQLSSTAGDLEAGDNSFAYANYTTGQDYSQFTSTSIPRFAPASGMDMGSQWGTADFQTFQSPFFTSYPKSTHSLETEMYSTQDASELMFPHPPQRQMSRPRVDTTIRPTAVRSASSFSANPRRPSINEPNFGAFVMSPTSAVSAHLPSVAQGDYEQQSLDAR
jgi:hypothetical protein